MGRLGHYNPPSHNAQRRLAGAISPVEYTQGHYPPPSTRKPAASMCQVPSKHRSMGTKVRFVEAPVAISQVHRWVRVLRKEPSPEKAERPFHSHARKSDAWLPSRRSTASLAVHNNEPITACSISLCNTRHGISCRGGLNCLAHAVFDMPAAVLDTQGSAVIIRHAQPMAAVHSARVVPPTRHTTPATRSPKTRHWNSMWFAGVPRWLVHA